MRMSVTTLSCGRCAVPGGRNPLGTVFYGTSIITFNELEQFPNYTAINDYAFQDSSLQEITLPAYITRIGYRAFRGTQLVNIVIPSLVTTIGSDAFWADSTSSATLETFVLLPTTPPTLGNTQVFRSQNRVKFYVPDESLEAYKTATYWANQASKIYPMSELPS